MTGKDKKDKQPPQHYYPGSEIDIENLGKQVERHFKRGIGPSAAIFLFAALFLVILTFLITPAMQVMAEYYLSPQQASPILKAIFPQPEAGHTYPKLYAIFKKMSVMLPVAAFFFALIGLLFHIKTKGKGIGRHNHKKKHTKKR